MKIQHIIIGSDHGGFELKSALITHLNAIKPEIKIIDAGTHSIESCDYPDIADKVTADVVDNPNAVGILCCGTGIGMSIRANRTPGIRAAVVHDAFTAEMAKKHNHANILCLGNRTQAIETSCELVTIWLDNDAEQGRHLRRVEKLG